MRSLTVWAMAVFLFTSPHIRAQARDIFPDDSLQVALITRQQQNHDEFKKMRLRDSLEKESLRSRLNQLRESEGYQRAELQKQLTELTRKDSLRVTEMRSRIDSLRKKIQGFPVVPFPRDTLFRIFNKLGSYSAPERAERIAERIRKIGDDLDFTPSDISLAPSDLSIDILYRDIILMSITETDAAWMDMAPAILAENYKQKITNSVEHFHRETNWKTILVKVAIALGILALLIILIRIISRIFRWTKTKITQQGGRLVKGIKIRDYELINVERELKVLCFFNTVLKWISILLLIYLSLPVLFGLFPWTRSFATILIGYFLDPAKSILKAFWDYLPNLFTITVIVFVFHYVLKGVRYLKNEVEREALKIPGLYPDLANPTYQIIRVLVYAFMLVVIFPYLPGSDSPVFQGVSVFLGLLFTFGSSGSLGNLIAGLVITYMRSFKTGDRVKIGEVTGDVMEKSMLVTRLRTPKNEIITIPNSTVLGSHLTNFSSDAPERGLIIYTTVTIGYDVPWRQIHQLLIDAALATSQLEKEPRPFVLQTSLDDFYVSYQLNAHTKNPNAQAGIYSELHQHIQDKFNEAGVEIMSPHYRAQRDGNTVTIPPSYLPADYQPPTFQHHIKDKESQ